MLARFEDFPTKKLEALRMAAALYSKLDTISTTLKNWQIESPVGPVIDKIENYFSKVFRQSHVAYFTAVVSGIYVTALTHDINIAMLTKSTVFRSNKNWMLWKGLKMKSPRNFRVTKSISTLES